MNLVELKERIAIGAALSPGERNFVLDCINEATAPKVVLEEHRSAPNYLGRIDQIWAFLSIDEGGEGVCAAPFGHITATLVAADKQRMESLKPIARRLATHFKKPVRLAKFSKREDVEIYQP